jgi:predicted lipoprotein with Yx(FWY)xxD motif
MSILDHSWRSLGAVAALSLLAACGYRDYQPSTASSQSSSTYSSPSTASASSLRMMPTGTGSVLVSPTGMTLYTYTKDTPGTSNCYGECAEYWPPAFADSMAQPTGRLSIVTRSDGRQQWAHDGMPLYTFIQDKKAGDMTGDNYHGEWHVVR